MLSLFDSGNVDDMHTLFPSRFVPLFVELPHLLLTLGLAWRLTQHICPETNGWAEDCVHI
jgi:hypothetical protein